MVAQNSINSNRNPGTGGAGQTECSEPNVAATVPSRTATVNNTGEVVVNSVVQVRGVENKHNGNAAMHCTERDVVVRPRSSECPLNGSE